MSHHPNQCRATVRIAGMTCGSCELLLERKLRSVPGVRKVDVRHKRGTAVIIADADNLPDQERIAAVIRGAGYSVVVDDAPTVGSVSSDQRKWMEIGASLLIVFALYQLFKAFDLVSLAPSATGVLSFVGILLIGLVAGTSSCLAVTGGLLLAMAAKYNETHQAETAWHKFKPLLSFNAGRLASYFVLGGVVGLLGRSITLSTTVTGYLNILVAFVMLTLALKILHIVPKGTFPIRPPKRLSHWIADLSESDHPAAPFVLGAMTFFLPCGFTQSLQLAALASGSFLTGALTMFIFALGTLPALLGISAISSTATGNFSRLFLRFSGTLVLILSLFNLNSGLTLAGIDLSSFVGDPGQATVAAGAPTVTNGVQEVRRRVNGFRYDPSNITIKAGVPVRWIVDGSQAGGCASSIVIPSLGVGKVLESGDNVIEFTAPSQPGNLAFSCGMGMIRGNFTVI